VRAAGDIACYLNCDEQYLPGTLAFVKGFFDSNPAVDVLFGGAVVVDKDGEYICSRQVLVPRLRHTVACHLNTLTCATFFRRSLVERGLLFDTAFRNIGDAEWIVRLLDHGVSMRHTSRCLSIFMETGSNLGTAPEYHVEQCRLMDRYPRWWRTLGFLWAAAHRLRRLAAGYYQSGPLSYSMYVPGQPDARQSFRVARSTFVWKSRLRLAS
jgi:hypothetical protein